MGTFQPSQEQSRPSPYCTALSTKVLLKLMEMFPFQHVKLSLLNVWLMSCFFSKDLVKNNKTYKTIPKQQTPVVQKERGMTSCRTLVTLTHPKSHFSHQKTAFQGIRISTRGRWSIVQAASSQWAASGASGTWQVVSVGLRCETQLRRGIIFFNYSYSSLISCTHYLNHWSIVRKSVVGPK